MKTCVIAAAVGVALLSVDASGVFAQAGSTGGTLGNTDKSISGSREEPGRAGSDHETVPRRHRTDAGNQSGARCANIAGSWSWFNGTTTITGSSIAHTNGDTGSWHCSDGVYVLTWRSGVVDHLTLSDNGKRLAGNNSGGIPVSGVRN
jgi:hypothetical protein